MARYMYAVLLGLIGAALVHILIVLLIPHYTSSLLWTRLRREAPSYRFAALPPDNPISQTGDPFFQSRLCRFNLAENPAHLAAQGFVPFWSLSIYTQKGENIYSITSSTSPGGALDMIAIDPQELMDFKHNLPEIYADSALTALNGGKNFAVLRALLPSGDWQKQVEDFFAAAKCERAEY